MFVCKVGLLIFTYGSQYSIKIILANFCTNLDYFKFQFHYEDGQTEKFSPTEKKLCLATQDDVMLWNCYSTCLSHSSLRTWWDQALKPQYEDTYDVFEGVPSHLVLGNKHSRTRWEFTLLPSFIMEVKSELMHEQQCSFVCYNVFCIILCAKCKKKLFMLQSKFPFF